MCPFVKYQIHPALEYSLAVRGRIQKQFTGDLNLRLTFELQILPNSKNFWMRKLVQ